MTMRQRIRRHLTSDTEPFFQAASNALSDWASQRGIALHTMPDHLGFMVSFPSAQEAMRFTAELNNAVMTNACPMCGNLFNTCDCEP